MTIQVRSESGAGDRNTPVKVEWWADADLLAGDGDSVKAIARATGQSKQCAWRWQE